MTNILNPESAEPTRQTRQSDRLILFGFILFLCGLITGLLVPAMTNPRMALAAHLEGIMNGLFLVVLGLVWNRLLLSQALLKTTSALALYGTFANLVAVLIAAITGIGKMMPIAGGKEGTPWIDATVSFLLVSLALSMITVCVLVITGFYKYMKKTGHLNSEKHASQR